VAAFVSIPIAVIWLPQGVAAIVAATALVLFVAAQAAKLIDLAEVL
jgi:hypothetical protein